MRWRCKRQSSGDCIQRWLAQGLDTHTGQGTVCVVVVCPRNTIGSLFIMLTLQLPFAELNIANLFHSPMFCAESRSENFSKFKLYWGSKLMLTRIHYLPVVHCQCIVKTSELLFPTISLPPPSILPFRFVPCRSGRITSVPLFFWQLPPPPHTYPTFPPSSAILSDSQHLSFHLNGAERSWPSG